MPRESKVRRQERLAKIITILKKRYPNARTALNWSNPLELLVATILSAQCTDKRVNEVTPTLFRKYPTVADYAAAAPEQLQQDIRATGFFRNKTKAIRGAADRIIREYGGDVPDTMEDLLTLPGVARKTANVVLGDAFKKREGIVVDTHVARLALRLGLTKHTKARPDKIEADLMELVPHKDWTVFAHLLTFHGREICSARKPDCEQCPVNKLCPSAFKA